MGNCNIIRPGLAAAVAASAAILLAACGGGGDSSTTSAGDNQALQAPQVSGGQDALEAAVAAAQRELQMFQPVAKQLLQKADVNSPGSRFTGNGWYWNPAESGTGLLFEAQGNQAVFGYYAYDDAGEPVWYTAAGSFTQTTTGFSFSGNMHSFTGGQPATSPTYRAPVAQLVGAVSGTFTGTGADSRMSMTLPGGRVLAFQRFNFGDIRFAPGPMQAETGWYWNQAESGRGYGLEIQGNQVVAVMFHYRADGKPVWNAVQGDFTTGVMEAASFLRYTGGQTLTGGYKAPAGPVGDGSFGLFFPAACSGAVKLPGSSDWKWIERFAFGTDQPCRTTAAGNPFGGNLAMSAGADYWFTSQERVAFNVLNVERTRCGFGALAQNKQLDQAAKAHVEYLTVNNTWVHDETAGLPLFTGVTPNDRAKAAGYGGIGSEVLAGANGRDSLFALRRLLGGAYHIQTLIYGYRDTGIGWRISADNTRRLVVGLGVAANEVAQNGAGVATYPCEGTANTLARNEAEAPAPFPSEPNAVWGQPIVVKGSTALRVTSAAIAGPTGPVTIKASYGDGLTTDPNGYCKTGWACIIPVELQPNTVYTATISGTDAGAAFTRAFMFRTGAE